MSLEERAQHHGVGKLRGVGRRFFRLRRAMVGVGAMRRFIGRGFVAFRPAVSRFAGARFGVVRLGRGRFVGHRQHVAKLAFDLAFADKTGRGDVVGLQLFAERVVADFGGAATVEPDQHPPNHQREGDHHEHAGQTPGRAIGRRGRLGRWRRRVFIHVVFLTPSEEKNGSAAPRGSAGYPRRPGYTLLVKNTTLMAFELYRRRGQNSTPPAPRAAFGSRGRPVRRHGREILVDPPPRQGES